MVIRIGFVVNPVAGIGGPAGLKGSDEMAVEATERGYEPQSTEKARRFLVRLKQRAPTGSVRVFTAPGVLGGNVTRETGWKTGSLGVESFDDDPFSTDAEDTKHAARAAVELGMDLLVFVGGDGTARDVAIAVGEKIPVLGVPAGVKMFSECFTDTPEAAADLLCELSEGFQEGDEVEAYTGDLLDLDEEAYREGRLVPRPTGVVRVPRSARILAAKCPLVPGSDITSSAGAIVEEMDQRPGALFVLGSGSTLFAVKQALGIDGTLIGVDAVKKGDDGQWQVVARDAHAHELEAIVKGHENVVLVLTPLGGQGSIIGRGTGPISPKVVRAALPDVWVVATGEKLASLRDGALHVDTGDPSLDEAFPGHLRVTTQPGRQKIMRVEHG